MVKSVIAACLLSILLPSEPTAQSGAATPKRAAGIAWLVFVDDLHIDFRNTGRVREFLHSVSTSLMRNDDVIVMRTSGPSSIALDATSDRAAIEATIRNVSGASLQPLTLRELATDPSEIDIRLAMAFGSASMLLDGEAGMRNRRRAMLYISNGYDSERGRSLSALFSRAAQQAQVKVFAVNAGALAVKPMNDSGVDPDFWKQVVESRGQTLRAIAEPTGGIAFLDDVDIAGAMARIRTAALKDK